MIETLFVDRWPWWAGGLAVGLFVLVFVLGSGHLLGVSTGYADACSAVSDPKVRKSWRLPFIGGIVLGGLLSVLLAGSYHPTVLMGLLDAELAPPLWAKALIFTGGGMLIGYGARLAGGCTSGHAIVGVAQLARSSIIATIGFMIAGMAVTNIMFRLIAG